MPPGGAVHFACISHKMRTGMFLNRGMINGMWINESKVYDLCAIEMGRVANFTAIL